MKFIGTIIAFAYDEPIKYRRGTKYQKARHIKKALRVAKRNAYVFDRCHKRPWALWVTIK